MSDRVIAPEQTGSEREGEHTLRPPSLKEFVGQDKLKEGLGICMEAARQRNDAMDHVLFSGPPGLGKTTLAHIIAHELGSKLHITSGPVLEKASELAGLLTSLQERDVLFVDEIHRLPRILEEYLYPAMEDFRLDIMVESGPSARSINLPIKPFTLVGATTRSGMLSSPLRDRFGLHFRLNHYDQDDLEKIIRRSAGIMGTEIRDEARHMLGGRCRGTPRIANRVLRRCRDVAQVKGKGIITEELARKTLEMVGIDSDGLDEMDLRILKTILLKFDGGPVGLSTLGAALSEECDTLEEVYEPYLIQQGFIKRTPRGRVATQSAWKKLGLKEPRSAGEQEKLL